MNTSLSFTTCSIRLWPRCNSWTSAAAALLIAAMSTAVGADGDLDTSFNPGNGAGGDYPGVLTIAIQPDAKIVIGGSFTLYDNQPRSYIARVNADGSLDTSFDPGSGADNGVESIVVQADGKIVLVGDFNSYNGVERHSIARVNANGTLDSSYDPGVRYSASTRLRSAALQPDGKLLIGSGAKFTPASDPLPAIERINPDGSLDSGFTASSAVNNGVVYSIVLQPDGKIIVGGFFPLADRSVYRLNSDGSLDSTFVSPTHSSSGGQVFTMALQPDGKIIVAGQFNTYGGLSRNHIARLNADGSHDTTFAPGAGAELPGYRGFIETLSLQADGRMVIGGHFTQYDGVPRSRIARVNPDGSLDTSFDPGTGASDMVLATAIQPDGRIVIGGIFLFYNNVRRDCFARLGSPPATPTPTPTATPTATATPTPSATPTPTPSATPAQTLLGNIATRLRVETGENVLIAGFIVTGDQPKKVMLRAIGSSLQLDGNLQDPELSLFDNAGELIRDNDNWQDAPNRQEIIDSTIAPKHELESAILMTLPAGGSAYTAVVRGANGGTGIAVVEGYDLDQGADAKLANISTRAFVQIGEDVMIGGFFVLNGSQKVIIRALGPSLPVNGRMADPTLDLVNSEGDSIAFNNNWRDNQEEQIEATTIPPSNDSESAIVATLPTGSYTAVVRGAGNTTGIGLVEVYALD